jgi:hypothetical protein
MGRRHSGALVLLAPSSSGPSLACVLRSATLRSPTMSSRRESDGERNASRVLCDGRAAEPATASAAARVGPRDRHITKRAVDTANALQAVAPVVRTVSRGSSTVAKGAAIQARARGKLRVGSQLPRGRPGPPQVTIGACAAARRCRSRLPRKAPSLRRR